MCVRCMGKMNQDKTRESNRLEQSLRQTVSRVAMHIVVRIWRNRFSSLFLLALGWRRMEVTDLSESSFECEEVQVDSAGASVAWAPFGSKISVLSRDAEFPLRKWTIESSRIILNTKFPSVEAEGRLWITPRFELGPYSFSPSQTAEVGSQIRDQSGNFVLRRNSGQVEREKEAIYCGTRAPKNWGHWLMNFLPGVMLAAERFPSEVCPPLIVPPEYRVGESRRELFDLMWGRRPVIVLDQATTLEIDILHWFEQPILDSPRPNETVHRRPKTVNISALIEFRRKILDFSGINQCAEIPSRRVFLAREEGGSRPYSYGRVHQLASDFGFEIVFLNRLNIKDQVRLMYSASHIVAPDGSALAGLLFSHPSSTAVVLTRVDDTEDWFAFGARISGSSAQVIRHHGYEGQDWDLDPELLRVAFSNI